MDKVTQSNASGAEESASAAEELNAQAESMKEAVSELRRIVDGAPERALPDAGHMSHFSETMAPGTEGARRPRTAHQPSARQTRGLAAAGNGRHRVAID
jgi:hypothetical protein